MSRALVSLFAALLLALPSVATDGEPDAVTGIRPAKLLSVRSSTRVPLLLDVRTPYEYNAGHIPGAVNIPYLQLEERLREVRAAAGHGIVVYCMRGPRARIGESILQDQRIGPLYHLDGGYLAWKKAGYSVEKTERQSGNDAKE